MRDLFHLPSSDDPRGMLFTAPSGMGVLLAQDQVNEAIIDANAEIDAKWITVRKVTCNSGLPLQAEIRRVLISKGMNTPTAKAHGL